MNDLREFVSSWLGWLAVAVGVMSFVSAISRIAKVGLAPILHDFIQFYRKFTHPIYELLNFLPFPFEIPILAVDLITLYIVLLSLSYRTQIEVYRTLSGDVSSRYNDGVDYLYSFSMLFKKSRSHLSALSLGKREKLNSFLGFIYIVLLGPVLRLSPLQWINATKAAKKMHSVDEPTAFEDKLIKRFRSILIQMITMPVAIVTFFVLNEFSFS